MYFPPAAPHSEHIRILSAASALPDRVRSSDDVDDLIAAHSCSYRHRRGLVEALSGVRTRRVAEDDVQCSDLAACAATRALSAAGIQPLDVDLVIFAAAGQDLVEPATAHIVQEKIGTSAQVFDVKNACNSFLNGMQLAESLILTGAAEIALVTVGEICSRGVRWNIRDFDDFRRMCPGFTMGDAGAAVVLGRSSDERGIFYRRFAALSSHWRLATIPGGGSMHPRGDDFTYLEGDGRRLKDTFVEHGPAIFRRMLCESGAHITDFSRVLVHQATVPYLSELLACTGIPMDVVEHTVADLGNMAAASLPVGYARALEAGTIRPGDRVLWLGLASGISIGVVMVDV
jgi:3-oxoacyl-(acyl-carrier-protein) synthase III